MKNKLLILNLSLIALMLFCVVPINAQEGALQNRLNDNNNLFNLPPDIKQKIDTFFTDMKNKNYRAGLDKFLTNSPISKKDPDFKEILSQIGKAIDLYGEINGYEIVSVKSAATSFCKVNIIGLHNKYPTRWEINFYRSPKMGLVITNFKFDDVAEIYLD
ncbi:MAG: hypothetical protein LBO69_02245 [Ignavibacteria bacterium]|jgi:hypothetical protein|nr:hypothetical protein [Ignavibacteria bacterium]